MRDNNFTKKQLTGISLIVKSTSKKYFFIKDWSLTEDFKNYNYTLFIDLYIDFDLLSKYVGEELNPYVKMMDDNEPERAIFLSLDICFKNGTDNLREEIVGLMDKLYQMLPEDLKIKVISNEYTHDVTLSIAKIKSIKVIKK